MTDNEIENYIDLLNNNEFSDFIFRSILSEYVDFAKVWAKEPQGNVANEGSYDFYFIKNNDHKYVAAVFDMHSDLHVFVKQEYRKKGHLSRAINEAILPHLASIGRENQIVTFNDPSTGEYCVKNWGFILLDQSTAEISLTSFNSNSPHIHKGYKLSYSDFESMKPKIGKARLYITMVKEQLEASIGKMNNSDIDYLENELRDLESYVFDLIEEHQGSLA